MAIADPFFRQLVDDDYLKLITDQLNRPPTVTVKRTSTLSITQDTTGALDTGTIVTWQAEDGNDFANMWDAAAPTVLTITEAGLYVFGAQTPWNSTTTSVHEINLLFNGTTLATSIAGNTSYGAANGHIAQVWSQPKLCAVNDTIRLHVMHNNTSALSLQTSKGGTWLTAQWRGFGA